MVRASAIRRGHNRNDWRWLGRPPALADFRPRSTGNWLVAAPELVLLAEDSKSRFPWLASPVEAMALKLAAALSFLADSGSIADLNELVAATPANCPTGFPAAKVS